MYPVPTRSRARLLPAVFAVFAGNYQRERSSVWRKPWAAASSPAEGTAGLLRCSPLFFAVLLEKGGIEIALAGDACGWPDL
jgi:hypothetical protein